MYEYKWPFSQNSVMLLFQMLLEHLEICCTVDVQLFHSQVWCCDINVFMVYFILFGHTSYFTPTSENTCLSKLTPPSVSSRKQCILNEPKSNLHPKWISSNGQWWLSSWGAWTLMLPLPLAHKPIEKVRKPQGQEDTCQSHSSAT